MPEPFVNPSVRSKIAYALQFQPLKWAGQTAYGQIAKMCADLFAQIPGVESVLLRGGSVRNCRPAISDLDFRIDVFSGITNPVQTLLQIHSTHSALKSRFLILGETFYRDDLSTQIRERFTAPVPRRLERATRFTDGIVSTEESLFDRPHSPGARFGRALLHYRYALVRLREAVHNRAAYFQREMCIKELRKSVSLDESRDVPADLVSALSMAMRELDRRADLPATRFREIVDESEAGPEQIRERAPLQLLSRHWCKEWNQQAPGSAQFEPTHLPFSYVWTGDVQVAEALFDRYLHFLQRRRPHENRFPIFVLTPRAYRAFRNGWGSDRLEQAAFGDEGNRQERFHSLVDHTARRLHDLHGELVWQSTEKAVARYEIFLSSALAVAARHLSTDGNQLAREIQSAHPDLAQAWQRLGPARVRGDRRALVESFFSLRGTVRDLVMHEIGKCE